ncbi:hypothetical protein MCEMKE14_01072 [Candidatus Nanopelagicaceae bacterium]
MRVISYSSYSLVAAGILVGALGLVRTGSLLIALGTGLFAISQRGQRKIELYLPLAISISLFMLALALPRGR